MATYSASATISISVTATYSKAVGLATATETPKLSATQNLATTDISKLYQNSYAAQSSPVTLDCTALPDDFGNTLNMATVKGVYINNTHASAALTVGGGLNPVLGTDQYTVKAGHLLPITSAFATGGSNKNLVLTPSASMSFQIVIVGI